MLFNSTVGLRDQHRVPAGQQHRQMGSLLLAAVFFIGEEGLRIPSNDRYVTPVLAGLRQLRNRRWGRQRAGRRKDASALK